MNQIVVDTDDLAPVKPMIFDHWATWYATNKTALKAGGERELYAIKHLRRFFGTYLLTNITVHTLAEYHTWRLTVPHIIDHFGGKNGPRRVMPLPEPATVNREVTVLKEMLKAAVPVYLKASPLTGEAFLPTTEVVSRLMTEDERDRLLAALDPDDRAIFLIGDDALPRFSDILDLRKQDYTIDADGRHWLQIVHPKTRKPYPVQLSDKVIAALAALPVTTSDYLFPRRRTSKKKSTRRQVVATHLRRVANRVGVPWGRKGGGNTFHWATRMTGATRMIDQGGEGVVDAVAQMGGWKNAFMLLQRYKKTKAADLNAIVDRLNKAEAEKTAKADATAQKQTKKRKGRAA
jgi:integrase